jgi:hypothetical protein
MEQAELTGVTKTAVTSEDRTQSRFTLSRAGSAIVTPACYLVAAFIVTWHLWANPAAIVAGTNNDQQIFLWFLRYSATAVSHGRLPALFTTALNAPQGINAMTNTSVLLPGVLLAPVTLAFGPAVTLTVMTTVGFAGSAGAMSWVLRRWGTSRGAALLAGFVYGFSPAVLQSSAHIMIHLAVLPPLIVDAGLRLLMPVPAPGAELARGRARRSARDGAWLGVLVAAQVFISEEVLFLTAVAGVLLVAGLVIRSRPVSRLRSWYRLQARYTVLALACAVSTAALLAGYALWYQFFGPLPQRGYPFNPESFVNDLTSFVTPSSWMLFHSASSAHSAGGLAGNPVEYLGYLGLPLLVALGAAMVAFWRNAAVRATAIAFVALAVFSLGGHLQYDGHEYWSVRLPWRLVEILVPPAQGAIPDRLSLVTDGAAAALLAFSLDKARSLLAVRWQVPGLATLAAVLVCLPLVPLPLSATNPEPLPAGWTTAFAELRLPQDARVLVVPTPDVYLALPQAWQAESGQPGSMIGGYFIGPGASGGTADGGDSIPTTAVYLLHLWATEVPAGSTYAPDASATSELNPEKPPSTAQVRADFSFMCPAAVVAVTAPGSGLARYLTRLAGPPALRSGEVMAWRPSSLGIARWQQDCRSGPPRTFSAWPAAGG